MRYFIVLLTFLFSTIPAVAQAADGCDCPTEEVACEGGCGHAHESYAPIGVMGEHRHKEGDWMVSYRFRYMNMEGNLNGSTSASNQQVLNRYMVTPTEMNMSGHMVGLMHSPTDDVTIMFMLPYMNKSMKHLTRRGSQFTTESSGMGDIKASALISLWEKGNHKLHFNAGVSIPTGTIDARDATPMGLSSLLPYPMQIGSGTFDLIPGMTYTGSTGDWSWGAQALGTIRTGQNKRGYQLGDVGDFSVWGAHRWNRHLSSSLRLNGTTWGDISGSDSRLNPNMTPTADPALRAGSRLDALIGLSGHFGDGHRLAVEGGVPIAQSLDGPQLGTKFVLTAGWQFSF